MKVQSLGTKLKQIAGQNQIVTRSSFTVSGPTPTTPPARRTAASGDPTQHFHVRQTTPDGCKISISTGLREKPVCNGQIGRFWRLRKW